MIATSLLVLQCIRHVFLMELQSWSQPRNTAYRRGSRPTFGFAVHTTKTLRRRLTNLQHLHSKRRDDLTFMLALEAVLRQELQCSRTA